MPTLGHLISGKVYDIYGSPLGGATVMVTHASISPALSATTNSSGEYIINLSGLESQWSVGDSISINATKTKEGTITETNTISSGASQTQNLTLTETGDFVYETQAQNAHHLVFAMATHYDGNEVTRERGLPVHTVLTRQFTEAFAYNGNLVQYHGWADPGTAKNEAGWRIQKFTYDGNLITDIQWADGDQNFDKKWSSRTTYTYK